MKKNDAVPRFDLDNGAYKAKKTISKPVIIGIIATVVVVVAIIAAILIRGKIMQNKIDEALNSGDVRIDESYTEGNGIVLTSDRENLVYPKMNTDYNNVQIGDIITAIPRGYEYSGQYGETFYFTSEGEFGNVDILVNAGGDSSERDAYIASLSEDFPKENLEKNDITIDDKKYTIYTTHSADNHSFGAIGFFEGYVDPSESDGLLNGKSFFCGCIGGSEKAKQNVLDSLGNLTGVETGDDTYYNNVVTTSVFDSVDEGGSDE